MDNHIENGDNDISEEINEEEAERKHFHRIINAFRYYRTHCLKRVIISEKNFNDLPAHHRALLPDFKAHLSKLRTCINHNYDVIKLIVEHTATMFENRKYTADQNHTMPAADFDMDKVRTTLKQFMRDWSSEGKEEREACYQPIISAINKYFPADRHKREGIQVLVPGAGLGRLAYEIAKCGFSCQGNEFSLVMLFASNFVLNKCRKKDLFTLYPWVTQFCNNLSSDDQIRPITFPDINPADLPPGANFSMAAGDFLEVYTKKDSWDCLATVFFLDTAHNILAYIETIHSILKPGGIWVNLGPLLYHFADVVNEASIEISYEDIKRIVVEYGFEILEEKTDVEARYTQNPRSMLQYHYRCVYFVARKTVRTPEIPQS